MPRPSLASVSTGSFHAGAPIPAFGMLRRQSSGPVAVKSPKPPSSHGYQTFPTEPPVTPLAPASDDDSIVSLASDSSSSHSDSNSSSAQLQTPLPVRQLLLLALLSLAEQTALNSIAPYLPQMVLSMPGIPPHQAGVWVGALASAFALAQLSTNFLWGYASDHVGRKPVLLAGTASLMCCFAVFGLCTRYWHIVVVHVAMGLLNGNAACVPTVLGEVTDRSNQSKAFAYLPVIYSLGAISGPALGGILVGRLAPDSYPYLAPNVFGAALLALSLVAVALCFHETLDPHCLPPEPPWKPAWLSRLSAWLSRPSSTPSKPHSWSSRWPQASASRAPLLDSASSISSTCSSAQDASSSTSVHPAKDPHSLAQSSWRQTFAHTTILLLATYLVFQLSNISFNSLYPIFAAAPPPTGRGLDPQRIGLTLGLAGAAVIVFQAFVYQPLVARFGSLGTYRFSLLGLAVSMALMPWVAQLQNSRPLLYTELGLVLVLKNICAVAGLSSVMLLITNSCPSNASLGTLNGVAQTLSALGRSIGPLLSGSLFTLSTTVHPHGEALVWSVFAALALAGWCASLAIHPDRLETASCEANHV
ncbi:hypothetical protein CDD82_980 [Ophiocordyceps australis]|uniref:Major facilitator superfamily (MFS) profile domain-containing protein n=1 Tax=Ophiocordyceps australis TaxID=1399860 RepID=A0A2C5YKB8_9HYPO|nr:hypothetical protein CDD82_980 [Ophiocordyceps australis]